MLKTGPLVEATGGLGAVREMLFAQCLAPEASALSRRGEQKLGREQAFSGFDTPRFQAKQVGTCCRTLLLSEISRESCNSLRYPPNPVVLGELLATCPIFGFLDSFDPKKGTCETWQDQLFKPPAYRRHKANSTDCYIKLISGITCLQS